jgi:hypothetical protein
VIPAIGARLRSAAGSANEARHALLQSVRREIMAALDAGRAFAFLKRIIAILWRMTRG